MKFHSSTAHATVDADPCLHNDAPECAISALAFPDVSGIFQTLIATALVWLIGCLVGYLLGVVFEVLLQICFSSNEVKKASKKSQTKASVSGQPTAKASAGLEAKEAFFPKVSVLEQFVQLAETAPEKRALLSFSGDGSLTYGELLSASRAAAEVLGARIEPGQLVALFLEAGPLLVMSILGTWMASAAWTPLDRAAPGARVRELLLESAPAVVICDDQAPFIGLAVQLLNVSDLLKSDFMSRGSLREKKVSLDSVAQVIYTSGSTGRPKGVVFSHRRLAHASHFFAEQTGLAPGQRVLQKTPNIWSVFRHEVYPALCRGAEVVFPSPTLQKDPKHLAEVIRSQSVSILVATPTILELVLDAALLESQEGLPSLVQAICMGEPLSWSVSRKVYEHCRSEDFVLQNFYGSTETENTTFVVTRPGSEELGLVPAGKPQPCISLQLLEPGSMEAALPGEPGEICFGGILADGYWMQPDLTAAKFIEHPIHGRLYRTGDLGVLGPAGDLEVLGRLDRQVKLRGARVELEEVEARLREIVSASGGTEVAVAATMSIATDEDDEQHLLLVAFAAPEQLDTQALLSGSKSRMASHMVPSVLKAIPCLPRLPNGKVDHCSLSELSAKAAREAEEASATAVVPALDSLGLLHMLSKDQLEEDVWIHNQQAFWILIVMLDHFQLVEGAAQMPSWDVGNVAWRFEMSLGHSRDMVAFMLMLGFTDSRDAARLGPKDAVALCTALLMTFVLPFLLSPGIGRLSSVFNQPQVRTAHGWFLIAYLVARLMLVGLSKISSRVWLQVGIVFIAAFMPDDLFYLHLPLEWRWRAWRFDTGTNSKGFRMSYLFLPACYLLAFHGTRAGAVSWARRQGRKWLGGPRRRPLRAGCFAGCMAGFFCLSLLSSGKISNGFGYHHGYQSVYREGKRWNGSHAVSWHYMTHPSFTRYVTLWLGEAVLLLLPSLMVSIAMVLWPWHLKTMGSTTLGNYILHPHYIGSPWVMQLQSFVNGRVTDPRLGPVTNISIVIFWNIAFCIAFAHTAGAGFHWLYVGTLRGIADKTRRMLAVPSDDYRNMPFTGKKREIVGEK